MLRDEEIRDATLNESFALLALMKDEVTTGEVARGIIAFARAVEQAAYEKAAQLCEKHADDYVSTYMAAELRATAFAIRLEKQEQPK